MYKCWTPGDPDHLEMHYNVNGRERISNNERHGVFAKRGVYSG